MVATETFFFFQVVKCVETSTFFWSEYAGSDYQKYNGCGTSFESQKKLPIS